jgi:hypothetical protein
LLVRRTDVRLSTAAAVGFGLGGVLLATVTDAPAPAAFMLGTTTALLGCIVPSLATCGGMCVGRWLWLAAPCPSATIGRSAWGVALVLTTLPAAVVGGVALAVSAASWSAVGTVAIVVVLAADTAAIAGVLVPWRGGAGDQLATFAAFGALAIATSLAIGVVAPRLVAFGLPDAAVALAACLGGSATATVVLRRGLEGTRA